MTHLQLYLAGASCADFLQCSFPGPDGGLLALRQVECGGSVEVVCAHTTPSMGFGVQSSSRESKVAMIARQEESQHAAGGNKHVNVVGKAFTMAI